jgi:hypothetical protein
MPNMINSYQPNSTNSNPLGGRGGGDLKQDQRGHKKKKKKKKQGGLESRDDDAWMMQSQSIQTPKTKATPTRLPSLKSSKPSAFAYSKGASTAPPPFI